MPEPKRTGAGAVPRSRRRSLIAIALIGSVAVNTSIMWWAMSQIPNQTAIAPQRVIEIAFSVPAATPKPESPPSVVPKVELPPPKLVSKPVRPSQPRVKARPTPMAEPKLADLPAPPPEPRMIEPPPVSAEPAPPVESQPAAPPVADLPVTPAMFDADYLHNPEPQYPRAAKRLGVQGTVVIRVTVTAKGTAEKLVIVSSSGSPLLDDAALAAVQRWTFVPAHRGNEAIAAMVDVPIRFTLQR